MYVKIEITGKILHPGINMWVVFTVTVFLLGIKAIWWEEAYQKGPITFSLSKVLSISAMCVKETTGRCSQ